MLNLRVLKIVVAVMGLMLVVGVVALAVAIAHRVSHPPAAAAEQRRPGTPFVAAPLELPPGAHIEAIGTGSDRAVLGIAAPDGSRELLVIDLATGRLLGRIPLRSGGG